MTKDILTPTLEIKIDEKIYTLEYNNKAYVQIEEKLNCGVLEIYNKINETKLKLTEYQEVLYAGLAKHHSKEEIAEVKKVLENTTWKLMSNLTIICKAFYLPLMQPDLTNTRNNNDVKKK